MQEAYVLGHPLPEVRRKDLTVTMKAEPFIVCKRKNVWGRLKTGGALSEPCSCPACIPLAF
jgi:hypothetical protein